MRHRAAQIVHFQLEETIKAWPATIFETMVKARLKGGVNQFSLGTFGNVAIGNDTTVAVIVVVVAVGHLMCQQQAVVVGTQTASRTKLKLSQGKDKVLLGILGGRHVVGRIVMAGHSLPSSSSSGGGGGGGGREGAEKLAVVVMAGTIIVSAIIIMSAATHNPPLLLGFGYCRGFNRVFSMVERRFIVARQVAFVKGVGVVAKQRLVHAMENGGRLELEVVIALLVLVLAAVKDGGRGGCGRGCRGRGNWCSGDGGREDTGRGGPSFGSTKRWWMDHGGSAGQMMNFNLGHIVVVG